MRTRWANAGRGQRVDRVGEDVEALFHDQPADEGDDPLTVADAETAAPVERPPRRLEKTRASTPPAPDLDVGRHAVGAELLGHRFGRGVDLDQVVVEPAHDLGGDPVDPTSGRNRSDRCRSGCGPMRPPAHRWPCPQRLTVNASRSGADRWMRLGANASRSRRVVAAFMPRATR